MLKRKAHHSRCFSAYVEHNRKEDCASLPLFVWFAWVLSYFLHSRLILRTQMESCSSQGSAFVSVKKFLFFKMILKCMQSVNLF